MFPGWNCNPETLEPLREFQLSEFFQDRRFECNRCGKVYSSLKSLRRHRFHCGKEYDPAIGGFVKNFEESDDRAQFECTYCNRAYRWKKGLKRHQQRCEAKMAQENPDQSNLEVSLVEKSRDNQPDESQDNLVEESQDNMVEGPQDNLEEVIDEDLFEEHKNIQTEPSRIVKKDSQQSEEEPIVDEGSYPDVSSKSGIMRNRNATSGRFQCILCGKRYGWLKNLRRHQRVCRKKVSKHRWKECKVMLEPLQLRTSKRISEQNFKCQCCGKEFKWLRDLRQHQAVCTNSSQNLWNVSEASAKPDKNPSSQKDDQASSNYEGTNNEGPGLYKCAFCSKQYTWRRSLRRHYLKCWDEAEWNENMIKFEPPPIDETGFEQSMEENDNEAQGTFRCSLCGRFYKWMKDLKRHRHGCGDQKPKFPCRIWWLEGHWRGNETAFGNLYTQDPGVENASRNLAWIDISPLRFANLDLLSTIKKSRDGRSIITEYEQTQGLSGTNRRKLVNITVDALVAKFGHHPTTDEKVAYAKEIIRCFPNLRDLATPEGYEIFFDPSTRSGFISWRLRTVNRKKRAELKNVHQNMKKSVSSKESTPEYQTRPRTRIENRIYNLEFLSAACPETQEQEIIAFMKTTIDLRISQPEKILENFPRFKDLPYLIDLEFSLMYPSVTMRPFIPELIFQVAENQPRNYDTIIKDDAEWDTITKAYIELLKMLLLTKGRNNLEPDILVDRFIQFSKVGSPLEKRFLRNDRPCLVAIGEDKSIISSYLIAAKGEFLSTNTNNFERAFDLLFKSHFVLRIKFDNNLSTFYEFVQSFYYGMEIESQFTPRMRELETWLSGS